MFEIRFYVFFVIGGFIDLNEEKVKWVIEILWVLSFLVVNCFDIVVKGLNVFFKDEWLLFFIYMLFNVMVGVGMLFIFYFIIGVVWRKVFKKDCFLMWFLVIFMMVGFFSIIGIEFGWIFVCMGR